MAGKGKGGAPLGNDNAVGHGAPKGNKNAVGNGKGAPLGNKNGARGTIWRRAIEKALDDYVAGGVGHGEALMAIANKVIAKALAGEMEAIQEIGNRLDGKPHQAVDMAHSGELTVQIVRFSAANTATE